MYIFLVTLNQYYQISSTTTSKGHLPSNSRLGVLEAPPSSMRSGGAIEGLARGGVCTLLLGGLLAVRSDGLLPVELPVDTWPGLDPSSWSEFGPKS